MAGDTGRRRIRCAVGSSLAAVGRGVATVQWRAGSGSIGVDAASTDSGRREPHVSFAVECGLRAAAARAGGRAAAGRVWRSRAGSCRARWGHWRRRLRWPPRGPIPARAPRCGPALPRQWQCATAASAPPAPALRYGWGDPRWRNPITGIPGCCARTASDQVTAALLKAAMNSRRFT